MLNDIICAADLRCRIGESPVWDENQQAILWCDALGPTIFQLDWRNRTLERWTMPSEVGSLGLCRSGRLVIALRDRVVLFDRSTARFDDLCRIPDMDPRTRLNDGKIGADGAFWVGALDGRHYRDPIASLYRIDSSGFVRTIRNGLIISNGLAWSPDGTSMFHSDSRGCWIDVYDFDAASGTIANRRRFAEPSEDIGRPDGATVDSEGFYWSCGVSAGRINRYSPAGTIEQAVAVPVPRPTMPCFGGPDLDLVFFTSLREGAPTDVAAFPMSGSLFVGRAEVRGTTGWRFDA